MNSTLLDSGMVRGEKEKKRPAWGVPRGIILLATPEGWRSSVLTENGTLCGRLDVPTNADPQDARAAAALKVTELARDFHDIDVAVSWEPPQEPWSWTAQVTLIAETNRLRRAPKAERQAQ
ncbi:hypothetical protein ACWGLE_07380 [Streptomyces sp. NPDC055897]